MNFFINEFSILSPIENKAYNEKFKANINLIVGKKDSGKTTLARSILYTLGCDVKGFDLLSKNPENIYILDFNIDEENYVLIRKRLKKGRGQNYFKIIENQTKYKIYYNTKDFKDFLCEIMKIEVIVRDKNKDETKLYPNHIFLPFYTDQDHSWQSYLTSTFNGINFIKDYKKIILEYFTGARPNEYYELQLSKSKIKLELDEIEALIKSKELIVDENNNNINIIENIDFESFKNQYKYFLEIYNNVLETEHNLKKSLNEMIYQKNSYSEIKSQLDSSIEEINVSEINNKCPNCKQLIHNTFEENYQFYLMQENLINEREKISMYLKEIEEKIDISMKEMKETKIKSNDLKSKLDSNNKTSNLSDRAESYALGRINSKLKEEINRLKVKKEKKDELLNHFEEKLNNLNKIDLATVYKKNMLKSFEKLNIPFSYNNYYRSNLESVKIDYSGTTKVQAFIAQYLSIYKIIYENKGVISIPMFIDTFLKDDFNEHDINKTAQYIFESLQNKHQSFIFMSNNEQTLNSINDFSYTKYDLNEEYRLLNKDYNEIFNKYQSYIRDIF